MLNFKGTQLSKRFLDTDVSQPLNKKSKFASFNLLELADGAAQITKMLLGLGAENNWHDVHKSRGRSINAGIYRNNWLYLSRKDRGEYKDNPKLENKDLWYDAFVSGVPQTFYYYPPKIETKTHRGYVARNAASAVLSLTGSCDQYAFVVAILLRAILPIGTVINICGLVTDKKAIPHTFVVVGDLRGRKSVPLNRFFLKNLLAVDAWTTIGGAVPLEDYFLCDDISKDKVLVVDESFIADGEDHLIKRVKKQKVLFDILKDKDPDIIVKSSNYLSAFIHHDITEQINYTKMIKGDSYLTNDPNDYETVFDSGTISEHYKQPTKSKEIFEAICTLYPHTEFLRCLEYVKEQVHSINSADEEPDNRLEFKSL